MDANVKTVCDFMSAAQTILAVYGSADGPIRTEACYTMMVSLLDDPVLLAAQMALSESEIILVIGEPGSRSLVL